MPRHGTHAKIMVQCVGGFLLALTIGCTPPGPARQIQQIEATLTRQAQAWNRGDVEAFMQPYLQTDELTFSSSGKTTRGWQATLDNYRKRYPTKDDMGRLTFSDLEIQFLENRHALVLGRWHLDRAEPIGGNFTLIMTRNNNDWIIIHDHTSATPPAP